jgi:hypothetical protein
MLMSVFSRGEAAAVQPQPQFHPTGNSTTFHNVLEVGVGSNVVKLTLSEGGLKTERVDAQSKSVTINYGLTKIEWYAVDDTTGELLIQYHEFNTDDKYQVAFRSPQYRAIWDCFCYYLCRKGEKLARSQKEKELHNQMAHEEDAIAPPLPSPGGSPAVPQAHQNRPTSGDHHYHQPTHTTASPSVGRSSLRNGPTATAATKKKMPPVHFSPRISMTDSPNIATSSSTLSHGADDVISFDEPLIVLPPPPRNRSSATASSPAIGRVALPPGPVSPSFSAFPQSPTGSFDMPALPSPGLSIQRRSTATVTSGLPPKPTTEPTPSAPAFDLIDW